MRRSGTSVSVCDPHGVSTNADDLGLLGIADVDDVHALLTAVGAGGVTGCVGVPGTRNIGQSPQNAPGSGKPQRDRRPGSRDSRGLLKFCRGAGVAEFHERKMKSGRRAPSAPGDHVALVADRVGRTRIVLPVDEDLRIIRIVDVDHPEAGIGALDCGVAPEREIGVEGALPRPEVVDRHLPGRDTRSVACCPCSRTWPFARATLADVRSPSRDRLSRPAEAVSGTTNIPAAMSTATTERREARIATSWWGRAPCDASAPS